MPYFTCFGVLRMPYFTYFAKIIYRLYLDVTLSYAYEYHIKGCIMDL